MGVDHRKIIDHITLGQEPLDKLKKAPPPKLTGEEALGLKFKTGTPVRDKITGKKGVIVYATRKIARIQSARG